MAGTSKVETFLGTQQGGRAALTTAARDGMQPPDHQTDVVKRSSWAIASTGTTPR